ncbi:MAG: RluA family pseudouridine synthase [Treponema sp.]|nr:RluA family pseudouridine synthase [Treponema sp.]
MKNIEILYEDDVSIIVNKPAGLAVQGGAGIKTSLDKILSEIRTPSPLLVHRLDRDTSGALLAAKGREAAFKFSKIFASSNGLKKVYIAVCAGCPEKAEGIITDDLVIRGDTKSSVTKYKIIETGEYSVLELEPGTGRMHQIRRHLAMKGNPILGDDKYGDFPLNKKLRKEKGLKRLLLHSFRLIIKGEYNIDISAPVPVDFNPYFSHN